MRLDTIGRPTLVQSESADRAKAQEMKVTQVAPVSEIPDTGSSLSQNSKPKLGQVLELMQKAQERKKKKPIPRKQASEAVKLYQRIMAGEEGEQQIGQTLDCKG